MRIFQKQSPGRIIAFGFAAVILLGSVLLCLPVSVRDGVSLSYIDALYTAVSAVCVTGLVVVDTAETFSFFGQAVVAVLIQIGGLGVTAIGAGIIIAMGKRIGLKGRRLIQESMNLYSADGLIRFVKSILLTSLVFELAGAALSFISFSRDYPVMKALWISIFHSVASFNNAGFDILGNFENMIPYKSDVLLNLVTAMLIIAGGIGFLVIKDILRNNFRFRRLSLHSKIVITMSAALIVIGTVFLKLSEDISWLGAFFTSVSTRTAGFSTYPSSAFTNAGLILMMLLMMIGASSGSTGGGIKTGTVFVLLQGIKTAATNKSSKAFKYSLPKDAFQKASVITLMALAVIFTGTYLMSVFEPHLQLRDIAFEIFSAFGTVGLSNGITPELSPASKILSMVIMYIGRLGPLTVASLWHFGQEERVRYPEGNIAIG